MRRPEPSSLIDSLSLCADELIRNKGYVCTYLEQASMADAKAAVAVETARRAFRYAFAALMSYTARQQEKS